MEQSNLNRIFADLEFLKQKIINIEANMIDSDCIMTQQERENLDKSLEELETGKTTSLEDFEKEIKNAKN